METRGNRWVSGKVKGEDDGHGPQGRKGGEGRLTGWRMTLQPARHAGGELAAPAPDTGPSWRFMVDADRVAAGLTGERLPRHHTTVCGSRTRLAESDTRLASESAARVDF